MPKRKHVRKHPVIACSDANQNARESLKERARIAQARAKKLEMLREQYMSEIQRRREEENREETKPAIISPTITPATGRDVANE